MQTLADAALLPDPLAQLLGKSAGYLGANCYQSALFAHFPQIGVRHVNSSELEYYLRRDFVAYGTQKAPFDASQLLPGDVLVFDSKTHAVYYLGGGKIFDLPAWEAQYAYRVVDLGLVHTGLLPSVGGDPHDRLVDALSRVVPFRSMEVYRRRRDAHAASTPVRQDPSVDSWKAFLDLGNSILRARFQEGPRHHRLLSVVVEHTLRSFISEWHGIVPGSLGAVRREVDEDFKAAYFELASRLDGYDGFVRQMYFSSVYMTEDKFRSQNLRALTPSEQNQDDVDLVSAYLLAQGREVSTDAIDGAIASAQLAFATPPRQASLFRLLP